MTFEWPSWVNPLPFPFPELHNKINNHFHHIMTWRGEQTVYVVFKLYWSVHTCTMYTLPLTVLPVLYTLSQSKAKAILDNHNTWCERHWWHWHSYRGVNSFAIYKRSIEYGRAEYWLCEIPCKRMDMDNVMNDEMWNDDSEEQRTMPCCWCVDAP